MPLENLHLEVVRCAFHFKTKDHLHHCWYSEQEEDTEEDPLDVEELFMLLAVVGWVNEVVKSHDGQH